MYLRSNEDEADEDVHEAEVDKLPRLDLKHNKKFNRYFIAYR